MPNNLSEISKALKAKQKKKTNAPKAIKLVLHLPVKGEQKQFNTQSPKGKTEKVNKSPKGYQTCFASSSER